MASFAEVESEEPGVRRPRPGAFDAHAHKFLATLRADGSPRISGIEMASWPVSRGWPACPDR